MIQLTPLTYTTGDPYSEDQPNAPPNDVTTVINNLLDKYAK